MAARWLARPERTRKAPRCIFRVQPKEAEKMRADQVKVGNIVQFRHGNRVHTGTVKTVGRNGEDETGSEVVIGDIYPHIYDQPTVTKHGGDLTIAQGRRFP